MIGWESAALLAAIGILLFASVYGPETLEAWWQKIVSVYLFMKRNLHKGVNNEK